MKREKGEGSGRKAKEAGEKVKQEAGEKPEKDKVPVRQGTVDKMFHTVTFL